MTLSQLVLLMPFSHWLEIMENNAILPYSWLQVCGRIHWGGATETDTERLLHSAIVLICPPPGASLSLQPWDASQTWHKLNDTRRQ